MSTSKRFLGEVVELSRDCELGQESDRAVVTALDHRYMTLTFPKRAPDLRIVYTGADYKFLRTYEGAVEGSIAELVSAVSAADFSSNTVPAARTAIERRAALRALRALVTTYLENSNDAPRAAELLDALEVPVVAPEQEARERAMFGFPAAAIDEVLSDKTPRDIAMYAMDALSKAQELICRDGDEPFAWSVRRADANTIRKIMHIAKYAIDKAVPREASEAMQNLFACVQAMAKKFRDEVARADASDDKSPFDEKNIEDAFVLLEQLTKAVPR